MSPIMKDMRSVIWLACGLAALYVAIRWFGMFGGFAPMNPAQSIRETQHDIEVATCQNWRSQVLPDICRRLPDGRIVHR